MAGRVTIQDIADALGLSRNTVSKAINNTGILADATREKILQKAVEMGYKQFSYVTFIKAGKDDVSTPVQASLSLPQASEEISAEAAPRPEDTEPAPRIFVPDPKTRISAVPKVIAMLSVGQLGSSHFSSTMLDKFQMELSLLGYELVMYRIGPNHLASMTLPTPITRETVGGIICFEMFDPDYSNVICDSGIPALFVDAPVSPFRSALRADRLLMENRSNIYLFVQEMVQRGKRKIGFIGNPYNCLSFYERYMAYLEALYMMGIPLSKDFCILENPSSGVPTAEQFQEYLADSIRDMQELPEVFLCANDFVALDTIHALRQLGLSVPDDVCLCGFDDSPESRLVTPQLTTIHIHSQIMGFTAVQMLMSRIAEPSLNYRTVYTETTLIYRASTGD